MAVVSVVACAVGIAAPLPSLLETRGHRQTRQKNKSGARTEVIVTGAGSQLLRPADGSAVGHLGNDWSRRVGPSSAAGEQWRLRDGEFQGRLNVEFAQSGVAVHVGDPKGRVAPGTPAGTPPNIHRFPPRQKSAPAQSRKCCHSPLRPLKSFDIVLRDKCHFLQHRLKALAMLLLPGQRERSKRPPVIRNPRAPPVVTSPSPPARLPRQPRQARSNLQSPRSRCSEKMRGLVQIVCTTSPPERPEDLW